MFVMTDVRSWVYRRPAATRATSLCYVDRKVSTFVGYVFGQSGAKPVDREGGDNGLDAVYLIVGYMIPYSVYDRLRSARSVQEANTSTTAD